MSFGTFPKEKEVIRNKTSAVWQADENTSQQIFLLIQQDENVSKCSVMDF